MKRNENGFTLIELLIVIIILGILAVIGIPKFMNSKQDAIVKACQTNRSSLEDAGERYYFDCKSYPNTTQGQNYLSATTNPDATNLPNWKGPYIKANFTCPANGAETYTFNASSGAVTCSNTADNATKKHAVTITD